MKRRLLTIGHSYCVTLNRRLPNELASLGDWDVTVVGPAVTADWRDLDLAAHQVTGFIADGPAQPGVGSNVLGDPRVALTWAGYRNSD